MALLAERLKTKFRIMNIRLIRILPVVLLCAGANLWAATAEERPNILWITAEDMSCELGCYGDALALTPGIDRLATEGIRYTRCFAEAPMCAPSRSTIITGMHGGPLGTSQMRSNHRIPAWVRGFPGWLRESGWWCGNNVKTDYNLADEPGFIRASWDESSASTHWRNRPSGKPFFCVFNYMDTHQSRDSRDDYAVFKANVQSRLKPEEISDPARMALPPFYPDSPVARRTLARYRDCITTLDRFVAKTLADLEADGLAENTIVVFFSDHGAGIPGGKAAAFRYGLRVPLIVRIPEKFRHLAPDQPGSVNDRLVCFADLAPTMLNLAGLNPPSYMHGRAFLGKDRPSPAKFVLGTRDRLDEALETTRWISDGRFHLIRSYRTQVPADQQTLLSRYNANGELCKEIRALKNAGGLSEVQKRFWAGRRPALMLFDSATDPWCIDNLADQPAHRERASGMLAELEGFILKERDLGFWPEPAIDEVERESSAYEMAREDGRYPLARILETARLGGAGTEKRDELQAKLSDADPSVRYWAVLGLDALDDAALPALPQLIKAMRDGSISVRVEAAYSVARIGAGPDGEAALDLLVETLQSRNQWAACRAARALELLGSRAGSRREAMRSALADRTAGFFSKKPGKDAANYGLEFALGSALEKLDADR